jgi:hypothetical protein
MPFIEHLSTFINADTPGYAMATIGAASVAGIFDSAYGETMGLVGGYVPVFICASADVSGIAEEQAITISATNFKVAGVEHDHALKTGLATLRLEKA